MSGELFKIFLSSGMAEFKRERALIAETLKDGYDLFSYEDDVGCDTNKLKLNNRVEFKIVD